jgi:hypothetical protein
VEIKPRKFLDELKIFRDHILFSPERWICVDSPQRGKWAIIDRIAFHQEVEIELPVLFSIERWGRGDDCLEIRIQAASVGLLNI